jgi:endonuclease YncB( thermonuclease family)
MKKFIKRLFFAVIILLVVGNLIFNMQSEPKAKVDDTPSTPVCDETLVESPNIYEVVEVIDGDTIIVRDSNEEFKVRLIGIDTPEISGKKACR